MRGPYIFFVYSIKTSNNMEKHSSYNVAWKRSKRQYSMISTIVNVTGEISGVCIIFTYTL